jgi:hypothetical protein
MRHGGWSVLPKGANAVETSHFIVRPAPHSSCARAVRVRVRV